MTYTTPPTLITATVLVTISADDLASGWAGNRDELGESIRATLHELIGDDGGAYEPLEVTVAGIVAA